MAESQKYFCRFHRVLWKLFFRYLPRNVHDQLRIVAVAMEILDERSHEHESQELLFL